jgi:hypothetical protein
LTIAELKESIVNREGQFESLDCRISRLQPNLKTDVIALKSGSPAPLFMPTPVPPVSRSKSLKESKFLLKKGNPLQGIIARLTSKHGGNVHDREIVTITSKSVYSDEHKHALRNVADLTSDSYFQSKKEPGQWVCWDFHEMCARPTHYTIQTNWLKSWVVESSLDGKAWTEIARKNDTIDFNDIGWLTASFPVSKSTEFRFIRLTQTGKNYCEYDCLVIGGFEIFGTLLK